MQSAILKIDTLVVTQGMNGKFSHQGVLALDLGFACKWLAAPFDGVVKKTYYYDHEVWLESCDKVKYADGTEDYMTLLVMHCNDISHIRVGQTIKQGEVFYYPGTAGYATGSHIHITVGKGKFTGGGWYKNSQGNWCITNQYNIVNALFLDSSVTVKNAGGYTWKVYKEDDPMTADERKQFDALVDTVGQLIKDVQKLTTEYAELNARMSTMLTQLTTLIDNESKVIADVSKLTSKVNSLESKHKIYRYYSQLPKWAKPTIQALHLAKKFEGNGPGDMNLTSDLMRTLYLLAKQGVFDDDKQSFKNL